MISEVKRQGIALLMLVVFGVAAQAGSPSVDQPTKTFAQIQRTARDASEHAQQFGAMATQPAVAATAQQHLAGLQDAVQSMGQNVASLEANRSSLTEWQKAALDQVRPLLISAAARTSAQIAYFNQRTHLWTPGNRASVQQIAQDTKKIASTLNDYIELQSLREREARIAGARSEGNTVPSQEATPVAQPEVGLGR
jgi:hypothetical protein